MSDNAFAARLAELRERRFADPGAIANALAHRERRELLRNDNRLLIVAADHPARGALAVRDNERAMANRNDLLERLVVALGRPGVDGVLGTPDIIDDLVLLGALEDKIVVGSMNRAGLRGSAFELDDRVTAYDVDQIIASGLDFAKLLVRIDLADGSTANTLERVGAAVSQSAAASLPVMLEPFMSHLQGDRIVNDLSADAVITSVAIASALGGDSSHTWLKLPVVEHMDRVMDATTLPTLLLGGDPDASPDETYASWAAALALPGVRGLTVGRTLLYPPDDDVESAVDSASALVHTRVTA